MKHCTNLRVVGIAILCLMATLKGHALCTLACNDQVQISLDQTGIAVVLPDMILDGEETACPGPKTVGVMLPSGLMIGDTVTCDHATLSLYVKVTDDATGGYCWGTIVVEDKLSPTIFCQDTTVNCTADLSVDSIGFPIIADNCNGTLDTTYFDDVVLENCNTLNTAILTRTWYVEDASGNQAIPCVQTITVVRPTLADVQFPLNFDNFQQPALSCSNADTSIAFTGMPMVDSIYIGNLCKITFTYDDLIVGGCGSAYSVIRKWLVLDCCSGEIITHDQIIKVEDIQPPVFDCPDTLFFPTSGPGCAGSFFLPALPVSDNCSGVETVRTIVPNGTIEGNGGLVFGLPMGLYTVRYEAMDWCGNFGVCEIPVVVEDRVVPVAICDEITQVSLTTSGMATVPAEVFDDGSYDECCGVHFSVKRMDEPNAPFLPEVTLDCDDIGDSTMVIVQVLDCYENTNTCMVVVLTDDKMPPQITCPSDVTLACTEWQVDAALPAQTGEPYVQENCQVDTLYYTDQENLNICHSGVVIRTFTVVDQAGFSDQCSQKITLVDNTPSTFFFPPDTLTDCSAPLDSISAGDVMAWGDCEAWSLNVSDEIFPINCGLKIFRTYTFLEWCSGVDTSYTQFIEVRDTNPPVWDQPFGSKDTSYVCPGDLVKPGPPTARDYCSPIGEVQVFLIKDTIEFMGCENRFTRTFTYTAMDTCGNVAEPFLTKIFVNDTIPPSANVSDITVACMEEIPAFDPDEVDAFDNCPLPVRVELLSEMTTGDSCMGTTMRTYLLTDTCGLTTVISQNFNWKDTIPPTADIMTLGPFPCLDSIPDPDPNTFLVNDNCKDDVTVEFVSDSTNVTSCVGLVWRTWRLTDVCGNDTLVTQILTVLDTVPPTANIINPPPFPCLEMVPDPDPNSFSVSDNCAGNVMVNFVADSSNVVGCNGFVWRTWRLVDECGNDRLVTQQFTVLDTIPPSINCPSGIFVPLTTQTCSVEISIMISATDNSMCDTVTITNDLDNGGANATGIFGLGLDTITFFAVDGCGNMASCIVPVEITEEVRPSNNCEMIFVELGENGMHVLNVDSLANEGLIGGEDFCTDVTYTLDLDTLDCDDYTANFDSLLGVAVLTYNLTVTDTFGNFSGCFNSLFLSDPFDICEDDSLVVGGLVFTENFDPMPNVETQLIDGNDMAYSMTSPQGWYYFPNVTAGADCQLRPYKNDDLRNGVTTYDLIKISRHILGDELLQTPFQLIAADANNSGSVTTFDVVLIRKVILYVSNEFPNNTSWRFVCSDYDFPNPQNPFVENIPEHVWLNNLSRDVYGHHFIGVKVGDVNGSANVNFTEVPEDRGGESLTLATYDGNFQKGEIIAVPVFAEGDINLEALQATIKYDAEKMAFLGIQPAALDVKETDYAQPKSGSVTLSWMPHKDTPDGRILTENEIIFILQFQIFHEITSLSEALDINSTLTPAIAYSDGGNPLNVNWRIHESPHTMDVDAAIFFELAQNRPNPFSNEAVISFFLKEKMPVRLEVMDLAGRKTVLIDEEMEAGWQETTIGREQLGNSGIYLYQLITPYGSEQRKMVLSY